MSERTGAVGTEPGSAPSAIDPEAAASVVGQRGPDEAEPAAPAARAAKSTARKSATPAARKTATRAKAARPAAGDETGDAEAAAPAPPRARATKTATRAKPATAAKNGDEAAGDATPAAPRARAAKTATRAKTTTRAKSAPASAETPAAEPVELGTRTETNDQTEPAAREVESDAQTAAAADDQAEAAVSAEATPAVAEAAVSAEATAAVESETGVAGEEPADETPVRITSRPKGVAARLVPAPGAGLLALLALAWLGTTLWVLQREISTSVTDAVAIASAAISLPTVVSASLVAGAASALVTVNVIARAGWQPAASTRWAGALVTSIVVGLLGALGVIAGYDGPGSRVLAATIAAAAVVGGAIAGLRPTSVVAAVLSGSLAVFGVQFVLNYLGADVISGASMLAAILAGLVGGLVPFFYLRRVTRRETTESGPLRWPLYMITGAGVGVALLVTEVVTRVGGAQVLDAVAALSDFDRAYRANADADRLTYALTVLFVGALATTIAFGRTLPSKKRV